MFGWEFPPFNSGGLGVACHGLVKGLHAKGAEIIFVLPKKMAVASPYCRFIFASEKEVLSPGNWASCYITSSKFSELARKLKDQGIYNLSLFEEVAFYALNAREIAQREQFDIIHAHDWLSYPAAIEAKKVSGKPFVAHIHATEFDRTGGSGLNQHVYDVEREGFEASDVILAVSNFTREKVIAHYGVAPEKVKVLHNAIDPDEFSYDSSFKERFGLNKNAKVVLFLGRITLQKGPDYFLTTARKVLEHNPDVFFVVAGSGDMEKQIINQAIDLGIENRVIFTGFLRGREHNDIYQMADLFVMPSVSEPFGLTALEALQRGTPILISKQSGVAEVVNHCLKTDFWDVNQMANKILAVLQYQDLQAELRENGAREVNHFTWNQTAEKCLGFYNQVLTATI